MRAAIVEREDAPVLMHKEDWAMAAMHNKPSLGFQFLKGAGAHEIRSQGVHGNSSERRPRQRNSTTGFGECQIGAVSW